MSSDSDNDIETLEVLNGLVQLVSAVHNVHQLQKAKSQRRWQVRPINQNKIASVEHSLLEELRYNDPKEFFKCTRMNVQQFDDLLKLVDNYLNIRQTSTTISVKALNALTPSSHD
jgi:5-bromo-4-chloroindolyl phosphate hydrolysis protein